MRKIFLFFLITTFLFSNEIINQAVSKQLYNLDRYKALLHYNKKFEITDKSFFISKNPTLKNELIADIKGFLDTSKYAPNKHPQCRFPARFLFIKKELNLSDNIFPKVNCPDLEIYKQKAPYKNISLIFASENIKSPSSMMGHTFFKFSGNGLANSISFYTFINSYNPLKLIYENTIPGMKGYFILRPYRETLYNYLENEKRNVWEYHLKLTPFEKKMIYYHTWELKDIKMKYYFTSYNCATVVFYILSSANPKILKEDKFWLTPLSVIKIANKYKMIDKSNLLPNDEWFIKLLENQLSYSKIKQIKSIIENREFNKLKNLEINKDNFYFITLAQTYCIYLYKNNQLSKNDFDKFINIFHEYKFKYHFDISHYKNPLKTPPERQISIGLKNEEKTNFLKFSFLPASHTLSDDNREYFNESALKIGYISFIANTNKILLDNFAIYNITNLIPYDILTKPISYNFDLSIKRKYDENLDKKLFFNTNVGVGIDFNIFTDINLFSVFDVGVQYNKNVDFIYYPKVGFSIYEILNSKGVFYYQPTFINNKFAYNKYSFSQNFFLKNNYKLSLEYKKIDNKEEYEVGIVKLF